MGKKCKRKIIAVRVNKKSITPIKKELTKQGYSGFSTSKSKKWYNLYYTKYKGKC